MRFTERLRRAAEPIWQGYFTHPFVTGIGDGSLSVEKFRFFLLQDYLYLYDYAKVFALGLLKSGIPEEMRFFSSNVDAVLNGEMNTHRAYMKRLGISDGQAEAVRMSLANRAYTNYMLSVGYSGGVPEVLAAILACSWSYAEIGERLAAVPGAAEHPFYGEWITGYAGEEYQATNRALIGRMDTAAAGLAPARLDALEQVFLDCSRFEGQFWQMSWEMAE